MILKVLKFISDKRSFAFAFLLLPMIAGLIMASKNFTTYPTSKFTFVELTFTSLGKMARDLEFQVSKKVEKTLNGIQGLVSTETEIIHEHVNVKLMFDDSNSEDKIRLFLQEKLDVLKIQLNSTVQDTEIIFKKTPLKPLIGLKVNQKNLTADQWAEWIHISQIASNIYPKIDQDEKIKVIPKIKKIIEYNISLDQLTGAMRLNGLTYQLGSKNGMAYLLEGRSKNIDELGKTIVAAKGQHIIKLSDVSEILLQKRNFPANVEIWFDKGVSRDEIANFQKRLGDIFPKSEISNFKIKNIWEHVSVHILEVLTIFLIFALIFLLIFKNIMALNSVFVFTLFFCGHFIFWLSVTGQEISSVQFEALNLSLVIGLFLWGIYLARIRTYFLPNDLELFIKRTLEQAVFFTYVEFLPTLITLFTLFAIFSLPLLMGVWSPYSKEIVQLILFYSVPLILFLLFMMCIFTPLEWLKRDHLPLKIKFPNLLKGDISLYTLIPFFIILLLSPFIKDKIRYRLSKKINTEKTHDWKSFYRGYGPHLTYFYESKLDENNSDFVSMKKTSFENIYEWWITPNGLQQIVGRKMISFQKSLEDFSQSQRVVNLENGLPVEVSFPEDLESVDFGHLLIAGENGKNSVYLKQIANPSLSRNEKSIYRSQLDRRELVYSSRGYEFPIKEDANLSNTALTILMNREFQSYKRNFWSVVLFSFLILSLYFNSFTRGGLALIYSQVFLTLPSLIAWLFNRSMPIDSLHLSLFVSWFPICALMFLSRSIDIERLRGNEKKDSVVMFTNYFNDTFIWLSIGVTLTFFSWPWISRFMNKQSLSYLLVDGCDYYGLFILISMGLLLSMAFRLFYTSTESHIDKIVLVFAKIYYQRKKKINTV